MGQRPSRPASSTANLSSPTPVQTTSATTSISSPLARGGCIPQVVREGAALAGGHDGEDRPGGAKHERRKKFQAARMERKQHDQRDGDLDYPASGQGVVDGQPHHRQACRGDGLRQRSAGLGGDGQDQRDADRDQRGQAVPVVDRVGEAGLDAGQRFDRGEPGRLEAREERQDAHEADRGGNCPDRSGKRPCDPGPRASAPAPRAGRAPSIPRPRCARCSATKRSRARSRRRGRAAGPGRAAPPGRGAVPGGPPRARRGARSTRSRSPPRSARGRRSRHPRGPGRGPG